MGKLIQDYTINPFIKFIDDLITATKVRKQGIIFWHEVFLKVSSLLLANIL